MLNFAQLQRGAFIGGMKALVKFEVVDRGQCFKPLGAARSLDDGTYLLWMAHASQVIGTTRVGYPDVTMNWFMVLIGFKNPPEIITLIFYPDAKYRSPEEMLKAARSYDDGGILVAKPPSF